MIRLQGKSRIINHDESLALYRACGVQYDAGRAVTPEEKREEFVCNVQPVNGRDLLIVPEGDRFKEQYWVFTNPQTALRVNDRVVRCAVNFQVQSVEQWGSYSRCRIMRVDVGTEATP